jgi:hypothetical protein
MGVAVRWLAFAAAMFVVLLPHRWWSRAPYWLPLDSAAFPSGIATIALAAAIGIPGFLDHAGATVSLANDAMIEAEMRQTTAYNRGMVQGFSGLSIFTFAMTPIGLLTLYLAGSGIVRAAAGWFEDPLGDPFLTGVDTALFGASGQRQQRSERRAREKLEGPDVGDRAVSPSTAGIPGCDLVIVSARRKAGWERGVVLFTQTACYRIGDPVERTIAGRLRTLYPLHEHRDLEAIRKSFHYDIPAAGAAGRGGPGNTEGSDAC